MNFSFFILSDMKYKNDNIIMVLFSILHLLNRIKYIILKTFLLLVASIFEVNSLLLFDNILLISSSIISSKS